MNKCNFEVEILVGKSIADFIGYIAQLRIDTFKNYPYLYEGNMVDEKKYINNYTLDDYATLAVIKVNGEIAGISTGIPLMSNSDIVSKAREILKQKQIEIENYYYYGEIIVLPQYRGMRLVDKMLAEQDNLIKTWGYKHVCILTVMREHNHPLKPSSYISSDGVWQRLGFKRNNIFTDFHWPTIQPDNSIKDIKNSMEFWTKSLSEND